MVHMVRRSGDPGATPTIELVVPAGVELINWPDDAALRDALARAGIPRLLAVRTGALPPPDLRDDEDWVRLPCDTTDLRIRAEQVLRSVRSRAEDRSWVDDQKVLHRGQRTAVLTSAEATVAEALLAQPGLVVTRTALCRKLWPTGAPSDRAIDAVVYRLRRSCQSLGLVIRAVRGEGFTIDAPSAG